MEEVSVDCKQEEKGNGYDWYVEHIGRSRNRIPLHCKLILKTALPIFIAMRLEITPLLA